MDLFPYILLGGCLLTFRCSVRHMGVYMVPSVPWVLLSHGPDHVPAHVLVHHVIYFCPGRQVAVPGPAVVVILDIELEVVPVFGKKYCVGIVFLSLRFLFTLHLLLWGLLRSEWC